MQKVFDYLKTQHELECAMDSSDEKHAYDCEFFRVMQDAELFEITHAANFLDIKDLLDLSCKRVADRIKECPTPQAIRYRFKIQNDFSPEEEDEVSSEQDWRAKVFRAPAQNLE